MRKSIRFVLALFVIGSGVLAWLHFVKEVAIFEESVGDVRARCAPQFAEKRDRLRRLIDGLPPPGTLPESVAPIAIDPAVGRDPKHGRANFRGVMDYQCLNRDDDSPVLKGDGHRFSSVIEGPIFSR